MSLWLRVRRAPICILAVAAMVVAVGLFGDLPLPVPQLFDQQNLGLPIALFLPIVVAIAVSWGLASGDPVLEAVACRPVTIMDIIYALLVGLLSLLSCGFLALLGSGGLALAAGRNSLGYIALLLLGRAMVGARAGVLFPAGFAFITALFGRSATGDPQLWAWPIAQARSEAAWALVAGLLCVGVVAAIRWPSPAVATPDD